MGDSFSDTPIEPLRGVGWRRHQRTLLVLAVATAIGILATAGFQLVAMRGLGPREYGVLASFIAFINVGAVGSTALRNSIAVSVATNASHSETGARLRISGSMIETLVLGGAGALIAIGAAFFLTGSMRTNTLEAIVTALCVLVNFLFAHAQGLLQGANRSESVVKWTTASQVIQLLVVILVVLMRGGSVGVLLAMLLAVSLGSIGASRQAARAGIVSGAKPFSATAVVVIPITVLFAWCTNADVLMVQAYLPDELSGSYAAAAVLIKMTYVIPTTLSLFLLPRFVQNGDGLASQHRAVDVTLAASFGFGVLAWLAVQFLGEPIVQLLYGDRYGAIPAMLPKIALMCLPWAMAQCVLIRITAIASKPGLLVLVVLVVLQWVSCATVSSSLSSMILVNGLVGLTALVVLYTIHRRSGPTRLAGARLEESK